MRLFLAILLMACLGTPASAVRQDTQTYHSRRHHRRHHRRHTIPVHDPVRTVQPTPPSPPPPKQRRSRGH